MDNSSPGKPYEAQVDISTSEVSKDSSLKFSVIGISFYYTSIIQLF